MEDLFQQKVEQMAVFQDSAGVDIYLEDEVYWECIKNMSFSEIAPEEITDELGIYAETHQSEFLSEDTKEYILRMIHYFQGEQSTKNALRG